MRKYHWENRPQILARKRAYRRANREHCIEQTNAWYDLHPEYKKAYNTEYYRTHKVKVLKQNAAWQAKQRKANPLFRLRQNLSLRIWTALKKHRNRPRTLEITGCTVEFLKGWLESRFKPGMSWDNYGRTGWHVDHIIPCAVFDFSKPEEVNQCFHYTNLQPLWAKENLSKGRSVSKIEKETKRGSFNDKLGWSNRPIPKVF